MDSNEFYKEDGTTTDRSYVTKYSAPGQPMASPIQEEQMLPAPPPPPLPLPPAVRPSKKSGWGIVAKIIILIIVLLIIGVGLAFLTKIR